MNLRIYESTKVRKLGGERFSGKNFSEGFTMLELVVATATVGIIAVVVAGMLFDVLGLQDRIRAANSAEDAARVLIRTVRRAAEEAGGVAGSGGQLQITDDDVCWSFLWNPIDEEVAYEKTEAASCVPAPAPTTSFFGEDVRVTNFDVTVRSLETGGREIVVEVGVEVDKPLGEHTAEVSTTIVNLVD